MSITRKNRFEVWPQGVTEPKSRHNDRLEAVEAAQNLGAGTHEIRVNGQTYLEVVNPDAGLIVEGGGVRASNISIKVNGVEKDVVIPVSAGDQIEVSLGGISLGSIRA